MDIFFLECMRGIQARPGLIYWSLPTLEVSFHDASTDVGSNLYAAAFAQAAALQPVSRSHSTQQRISSGCATCWQPGVTWCLGLILQGWYQYDGHERQIPVDQGTSLVERMRSVMASEAWFASQLSWAQAGMDTAQLVALRALEPLCRTASERAKV